MAPEESASLLPEQLAQRFLAVFSRLEYALKATEFAGKNSGEVIADWDRFGRAIDSAFAQLTDNEAKAAARFLLTSPPRKHVPIGTGTTWKERERPQGLCDTEYLLRTVRHVRNNLVHGGKYNPDGAQEPGRDEKLTASAVTVLMACIPLHAEVQAAYERVAL